MKKISAQITILLAALFLSVTFSYVYAEYVDPGAASPGDNSPGFVTTNDTSFGSGVKGFAKLGKVGLFIGSGNIDQDRFSESNGFVIMGQSAADGVAVSNAINPSNIFAELPVNSSLVAFFMGDSSLFYKKYDCNDNLDNDNDSKIDQNDTQCKTSNFEDGKNNLLQVNDNIPLVATVDGHTRAPRIVVGSNIASPALFNLYVEPKTNATNIGENSPYCTMTASDLKNLGCPTNYGTNKQATYLGQVMPGTNTDVVAKCYLLAPTSSSNKDLGSCY